MDLESLPQDKIEIMVQNLKYLKNPFNFKYLIKIGTVILN